MSDNNEILQQLLQLIKDENSKQTDVIRSTIKVEIAELKNENNKLKEAENKTNNRVTVIEESNKTLKEKNEQLERKLKKNNIIIFGLKAQKEALTADVINKLNQLLQINLNISQINNIYTVGKKQDNKPIIVELTSYITKIEILKNCKKLKGTEIKISEDLTKKDQETRKQLLKHQREARKRNLNAYIRGNKLIINNDVYTLEDLEKVDLSVAEILPEKEKLASEPLTPTKLANAGYETEDSNEDDDKEEFEVEAEQEVEKRQTVKVAHNRKRPPTRRLVKQQQQSTSHASKIKTPKKKN